MNTVISYANHFKIAPGMMALDRALDAENCPVPYRKYFATDWLVNRTWADAPIAFVQEFMSSHNVDISAVCSTWYNNVYGHAVYEPPASRFAALVTPVPVIVTWSSADSEVTLSDITLIQYELEASLSKLLSTSSTTIQGMKNLQNMPIAKWVWLAMSDFDISVTSFELSRPAYHLSLWHSLQALEKLLKAALLSQGETEKTVRKHSHDIKKLLAALGVYGVTFSNQGNQVAEKIAALVGGPSVRYVDDSCQSNERISLAEKAIEAHHLFLEFLALEGKQLANLLTASPLSSIITSNPQITDRELRAKIHSEHKQMCSHAAYTRPAHALPMRQDITHPVKV